MEHVPRAPRAIPQRQAIGRRVRSYRLALGLTSRDVAAHVHMGHHQMTSVETASQDVLLGTLVDIAEAVGLNVALAAEHHLPLLDLTADEVAALADIAGTPAARLFVDPVLRSALDKLTTTKEPTDAR